ncbi:MAG: hypothetical protein J6O88_13085 [Chryseobacterium sp.]|uniref:TPR end-of-group domain-containing protein n=1 Tax=Chryseobacterium sp. TaxID=1871047 RepID=UPI001AFD6258|nr:hypothetical protein [Chryseobacterium sp.]MBO6185601.1 hypothetical protein [Chryseobacterium sp.]
MENNRTIEDIAYLIKQAKDKDENKPIIFLGAGASASAGIPLVGKIIEDILELHKDKPSIKRLTEEQKKDYYKLMSALSAQERRSLFYNYINDEKVKLNVTHIYLAQMLKEGLIDYVLTSNFDDLMLKACAMFNFIPPVYDVSILNDFTTTTFLEKSVTYLHGQHHGQWLLNAVGELTKVKDAIPKIFERICNNRTWIVVGYSGEDELLNEIAKIGSFENELYWVGYNESPLSEQVKKKLFSNSRTNAYHIKGYDSDSFFLKLHSELGIQTPEIFNKPFSFLKTMLETVRDIQIDKKSEHKTLFEGVQERMEISKKQVSEAIELIENKESEEQLMQRIIEKAIKHDFSIKDAVIFEAEIEKNKYGKALKTLGNYYGEWGIEKAKSFRQNHSKVDLEDAIANLKKGMEFNPSNPLMYSNLAIITFEEIIFNEGPNEFDKVLDLFHEAENLESDYQLYCNWGIALSHMGEITKEEKYFKQSFLKFEKAIEINPLYKDVYFNWARALDEFSKINNDKEILREIVSMYKKALSVDDKNIETRNYLGISLKNLATIENDDKLFKESIEVLRRALQMFPEDKIILNSLGLSLFEYGGKIKDLNLLTESLNIFKKIIDQSPGDDKIYNNCGIVQAIIAKEKKDGDLFKQSFKYFEESIRLNANNSKVFFNWGTSLYTFAELEKSSYLYFESAKIFAEAQKLDLTNDDIYNWLAMSFLYAAILDGNELWFWESFQNFEKALEINPSNKFASEQWVVGLMRYSNILNFDDSIKVLLEALEKSEKNYLLGANPYNLSCIYSMLGDKENALKYLKETLEKELIQIEYINDDNDWDNFKNDPDFINLLSIYN